MNKIICILSILLVVSCTTQKSPQTSVQSTPLAMQSSMVTARYSNDRISPSAIYQWAPQHIEFHDDSRLAHANLNNLIQKSIINELNSKGYSYEPDASQPDFQIAYVAALKTALDDLSIERKYGIRPGLVDGKNDQSKYEKGTIIVDLIEPVSGRLIWRGAGQAMATLEDIPQDVRKSRVQKFIKDLFSALPGELQ